MRENPKGRRGGKTRFIQTASIAQWQYRCRAPPEGTKQVIQHKQEVNMYRLSYSGVDTAAIASTSLPLLDIPVIFVKGAHR